MWILGVWSRHRQRKYLASVRDAILAEETGELAEETSEGLSLQLVLD